MEWVRIIIGIMNGKLLIGKLLPKNVYVHSHSLIIKLVVLQKNLAQLSSNCVKKTKIKMYRLFTVTPDVLTILCIRLSAFFVFFS